MKRKTSVLVATLGAAIALSAGSAWAQSATEIPRGTSFTVENGAECAPNADVIVFHAATGEEPRRIGATVSDASGHFSVDVAIPTAAPLGAAAITVDCGVPGGVLLYDVVVLAEASTDLVSYAPYALGALGVLVLGAIVVALRRRARSDADEPEAVAEPAPLLSVPVLEDADDDPDYWFWEATTEHGPVKRLACLTHTDFYLHEVPAEAFNALLEALATSGPDHALASAFFRVPVDAIDEIRHQGTEMRVAYRASDGFVAQTIDLATEVDGVIDLLSRRVPVIAEPAPVAAT